MGSDYVTSYVNEILSAIYFQTVHVVAEKFERGHSCPGAVYLDIGYSKRLVAENFQNCELNPRHRSAFVNLVSGIIFGFWGWMMYDSPLPLLPPTFR